MSEKRFKIYQDSIRKFESNNIWGVKSETNSLEPYMTFKEAEKCCDLLNEQQDTIFKLQDLCGKSDSENAKLRIENKRLQEEKGYWESKAMTLLMQVRRLTSRMTDKEVEEFKKELEE